MRTRRTKSRRTPHFANVIEHLESRCLLSGTGDLVGDTPLMASDLGVLTAAQPLEVFGTIDDASDRDVFQFQAATHDTVTIALSDLTTDFRFLDTAITLLALDSPASPLSPSAANTRAAVIAPGRAAAATSSGAANL